jgi:hypothetical protein
MNDPVRVDKASLDALTETLRNLSRRVAKLESENAELKAILARSKTSLAEQFNDPMESGVCGEQSSAP